MPRTPKGNPRPLNDRRVMTLADFTEEDIAAIERAEAPPEAAQFDHEYDEPEVPG